MFNTNFYKDTVNYLSNNVMYLQNELYHFAQKMNLVSKLAYNEAKLNAYESCTQAIRADRLSCLEQTREQFQQMDKFLDKANEMLDQANKMLEPAAPYILAGLGMYATYKAVSTVAYYCSAAKQDGEIQSPTTEKREEQALIETPEAQVANQTVVNASESILDEVDGNSDADIVTSQNPAVIERRHSI